MLFAFDFDGVIADSLDHNVGLMNQAARSVGLPELFRRGTVSACEVMTWEYVATQCGVPDALHALFCERLYALLRETIPPSDIFEGIPALLATARSLGRVVVVTSNLESLVWKVLEKNGLTDSVEQVFGSETAKDKTEKLRRAAAFAGVPESETIKIGDSVSDIEHARRAGTRVIAVTWGFQGAAQLAAAGPDALVDSPAELAELIRTGF